MGSEMGFDCQTVARTVSHENTSVALRTLVSLSFSYWRYDKSPHRPENNAKNRFNAYLHPKIEKYLARKWNHPDFCLLPNQNGCYDFVEDLAAMLKDVRAGKCDAASHFKPVANPTSPLHKPPLQSLGSVLEQTRVKNDSASLTCAIPAEAESIPWTERQDDRIRLHET
jgi:hypothetical protein